MTNLPPRWIGDTLIDIPVPDARRAQALATLLRADPAFEEVVAGLTSVTVKTRHPGAIETLASLPLPQPAPDQTQAPIIIPVRYGGENGPDLQHLAQQVNLTPEEIIARHTAPTYHVDMIGFTPGFTYLSGLDPALTIPRLSTPRQRIPAGSVGISGPNCGLYALQGPGGWPLIGHTSAPLFDSTRDPIMLLAPGMSIRFEPV